jgi:hypothetical protein
MPTGSLRLHITDLLDEPIEGRIDVDFQPARDSPGGSPMNADLDTPGETDFVITNLECRGGPGTLYAVRIETKRFRTYAFFQMILEGKVATASDNQIRLVVNPGKVEDIAAPAFNKLDARLRSYLTAAAMQGIEPGDRDLVGLTGPELYDQLGPLRKACLLNLFAKASHASSDKCFRFLQTPRVLRQDRCFCSVDPAMQKFLEKSERFRSVPDKLHQPLESFQLENSFKSRDPHANLQVTFMRHTKTGELAADVDIDEAAGIEHGFEVIRNSIKRSRTNPYLVRELLLLVDPIEKILDPGYRFIF